MLATQRNAEALRENRSSLAFRPPCFSSPLYPAMTVGDVAVQVIAVVAGVRQIAHVGVPIEIRFMASAGKDLNYRMGV